MTKLVPDTSILIDQMVCPLVQEEYENAEVLIPEAVLSEIENHANRRKDLGYLGIDEIKNLRKLSDEGKITISFVGRRPQLDEISIAGGGEIDAMIRDIARKHNAILLTSDKLQNDIAQAQGIETYFYQKEGPIQLDKTELESYFLENMSSVHLRENTTPIGKRGTPGKVELVEIDYVPLRYKDLDRIAKEVI